MDPLETLSDHGGRAEQPRPSFAAQSREKPEPCSLRASTTKRDPFLVVAHGGVVDPHLLAVREMEE